MKLHNVMVTEADSEIGSEFVHQLVSLDNPPYMVFATYRNENLLQDLEGIRDSTEKSQVVLIKMDITEPDTVALARDIVAEYVGDEGLSLLINNADVSETLSPSQITIASMEEHFLVNTVGPLLVYQVMLPLLEMAAANKSDDHESVRAAVLTITSFAADTDCPKMRFANDPRGPAYKISKVALNMAMRNLSKEVKNVLVIMMYPGTIQMQTSDLTNDNVEPKDIVSSIMQTLNNLNFTYHGSYVDRFGKEYPI